jgi:hypothetical protein
MAGQLPPDEHIGFATHRRALREWHEEIVYGRTAPRAEYTRARLMTDQSANEAC